MRPVRAFAAVLVTLSLALSACGGDDPKDEPESKGEATIGDPDTWPMTGLPVEDGESSEREHPVMVVKMDNTEGSAPQTGLGSADLVVEELVEGGVTRLAVFYYSDIPGTVGPVRSMRASDIGIVTPAAADVVTSGAAGVTIDRIKKAGIDFYDENAKGFERDSGRSAPYNLFANLGTVAETAQQKASRPDDYLPWTDAGEQIKGQPATQIAASFSGGHTTNWRYAKNGYVNENSFAGEGDEFPADTVLVLRVKVGDAGYTDPAGNPVPETKFEGQGQALLFHNGQVVRGSWAKDALESPLKLSTKAGELKVPAGRVWIELVPTGEGGNVTYK